MSEHSDMVKLLAQKTDSGKSIVLQVLRGTGNNISCRLTESPVIISQCRNPGIGKRIGNNCKRLMTEHCLVPILQPASGNHEEHRSLPGTVLRHRQCPFQNSITIGKRNIGIDISKWPDRGLGTPQNRGSGCQRQRKRHSVLRICPGDEFTCPKSFV